MSIPSTPSTPLVNNVATTSRTITNGQSASRPTLPLISAASNSDSQGHAPLYAIGNANVNVNGNGSHAPQSWIDRGSINRKRKWTSMGFNEAEQASMERTTMGFHLALAQDQVATLYPEPPTAFASYEDMINRLVPYHIWQTCDEELEGQDESEKKRKQRVEREETEAKSVIERMTSINQRMVKLRTREAQHPSRPVDLINMISQSTTDLREELSAVQREYRRLNAIRDTMEWEARKKEEVRRREEQMRREQAERAQAAAVAARMKHGQASTSVSTSISASASPAGTPVRSNAPSKPATPASTAPAATTSTSSMVKAAAASATPIQTTPTRGRGRPRGGGLRAQVLTHSASVQQKAAEVTSAPASPATPSVSVPAKSAVNNSPGPSRATTASPVSSGANSPASDASPGRSTRAKPTPGVESGIKSNASTKGPVHISVPKNAISELIFHGVLPAPNNPTPTPATIARRTEESVVMSIDLGKCTPKQLVILAKVLKVEAGGGSGGTRDAVAQKAFPGKST